MYNSNTNSKKKFIIIGTIATIVIVVVVLVIILLSKSSTNKAAVYLPKGASGYEATCAKAEEYASGKDMTLYTAVGMTEIKSHGYVSYDFVQVISKNDGSAIQTNKNNQDVAEEIADNLKSSGYLGVSADFKDGKIVVEYSLSNYNYDNVKDAKKMLESSGYSCK